MLILNAGINRISISLGGAAVGMFLLSYAYFRGHRRIEPAVAWVIALVVCVSLGGVALNSDLTGFLNVAARILCGVVWILWLGTQIDWAGLRQLLLTVRTPEVIVSTLDSAILHGVLTQREWRSRRNAARLRLGAARLSLRSLARLLGEGALHAFLRLERTEENALIRCSTVADTAAEDVLRLEGVTAKRGSHVVLEALDLRLKPGEWAMVCGPSGAGKSSLLRLFAGLDAPVAGKITRLGRAISSDAALSVRLDGRIGLLVQNPEHHFIASTVVEDIEWGLLQRGMSREDARQRAEEMATALGIESLLERPCHALSFGEQRRVALAGLLVLEPSLLLLDEPTSGLDPVAAQELCLLVQRVVKKTGASVVWATHDFQSPPETVNRLLLLNGGRIIFDGPTSEGLTRPWLLRAGLAIAQESEKPC
ncbi:MAG: ABC transporter ATP-binding protein [Myxococcota bacterium]|nr:ABC transporter ATP-binding protein [Myxococcota bacterium]